MQLRTSACLLIGIAAVTGAEGCREASNDVSHYRPELVLTDPLGGSDAALSPDGTRLAFSSQRSGNWDIWIYDLRSRAFTRVTDDPADDIEAQWAPDGQRLAFTSTRTGNKEVFVVTLADKKLIQLTHSPDDDEYPAWSPDGQTIVYTGGPWKKRDFFLIEAKGGAQPRALTQQSGWAGACSFFPDGRSVICHRYDFGSGDIVRLPIDGAPAVVLTSDKYWDYKPAVSPKGDWIAFSRKWEGPSSIWAIPVAGGPARRMTTSAFDDRWPTWSASGQMLFHRVIEEGIGIAVLERATGVVRTLVGPDEHPLQASFAPSGKQVAYCAELGGSRSVRILDLATGKRQNLTSGTSCFPRWSPKGDRIAFVSYENDRWEIATSTPNGENYRVWTREQPDLHGTSGVLDWSPDGTRIVFHAETEPYASDLFMVDVTTGAVRNLTGDEAYDESPSFSADGNSVLFMSTRGGDWTWGLFRLGLDDGAVETVVKPDYQEKNFARMGGGSMLWSARDGHGREVLTERQHDGTVQVIAPNYTGARWASYSPDGTQVLFTTVARRTEYWVTQGVFAADSPIHATPRTVKARVRSCGVRGGRSPVRLDHR